MYWAPVNFTKNVSCSNKSIGCILNFWKAILYLIGDLGTIKYNPIWYHVR